MGKRVQIGLTKIVTMKNTFGEYHRSLREDAGFGLREFANLIDVKPSTLSAIECGNRKPFPSEKLVESASALGLYSGSPAWNSFFDLARSKGSVPADVAELAENDLIPALLRTVQEANLTDEQLAGLIERIRRERRLNTDDCG